MSAAGLSRLVEGSLARGMFPSVAPENIPAGGAFDITNGLLDEDNVVYRRGGTSYLVSTPLGEPRLLWNGLLRVVDPPDGSQLRTFIATDKGLFTGNGTMVSGTAPTAALTRAQVLEGVMYLPGGVTFDGSKLGSIAEKRAFYATAGGRLLAGEGSRIGFSQVPAKENDALTWAETDFHQLPGGVQITGMQGLRTSCVVFTTEGIWVIGGLEKELTDAEGNVQQTLDLYSAGSVLWGNNGVASWTGGLVVPCKDNIFLMQLGVSSEKAQSFVSISSAIENLYRGYVAAGYTPGVAAVHRGHYFLPILNGTAVVDMLVCRLDATDGRGKRTFPWTHLAGYGAALPALAVTDEDVAFLGATSAVGRILTLGYFTPGPALAADADGSTHPFSVTYRDILTGNLVRNLVAKARLSYHMSVGAGGGATELVMEFGSTSFGPTWGGTTWGGSVWVSATGPFAALGEAIPAATADPEALTPRTWRVGRKVRYARVKVSLSAPVTPPSYLSIRALELFVRQDGRLI